MTNALRKSLLLDHETGHTIIDSGYSDHLVFSEHGSGVALVVCDHQHCQSICYTQNKISYRQVSDGRIDSPGATRASIQGLIICSVFTIKI